MNRIISNSLRGSVPGSMSVSLAISWTDLVKYSGFYFVQTDRWMLMQIPARILISKNGNPFLDDFYVAYKLMDDKKSPGILYYEISPECYHQARVMCASPEILVVSPHIEDFHWECI